MVLTDSSGTQIFCRMQRQMATVTILQCLFEQQQHPEQPSERGPRPTGVLLQPGLAPSDPTARCQPKLFCEPTKQ